MRGIRIDARPVADVARTRYRAAQDGVKVVAVVAGAAVPVARLAVVVDR